MWTLYRSQAFATVAFDAAGGSATPAEQALVGATIPTFDAATRESFTFAGWFTAPTGGTAWNFSTVLTDRILTGAVSTDTADLALYTQWTAPELAATGVEPWPTVGLSAPPGAGHRFCGNSTPPGYTGGRREPCLISATRGRLTTNSAAAASTTTKRLTTSGTRPAKSGTSDAASASLLDSSAAPERSADRVLPADPPLFE